MSRKIDDESGESGHPKPEVFISWSGTTSKNIARLLHQWLPEILPISLWMSSEEIPTGKEWWLRINDKLKNADAALLILTPENIDSAWLNYELGALNVQGALLFPYLYECEQSQFIEHPLNQFQLAASADEIGTRRLLEDINEELHLGLCEAQLETSFKEHWRALEQKLAKVSWIQWLRSSTENRESPIKKIDATTESAAAFEVDGDRVTILDVKKREILAGISLSGPVSDLAIVRRQNRFVAAGQGRLEVREIPTGKLLETIVHEDVDRVWSSYDGEIVVSASKKRIIVVRQGGEPREQIIDCSTTETMVVLPSFGQVVYGKENMPWLSHIGHTLSGPQCISQEGDDAPLTAIAVTTDGNTVVTGNSRGAVKKWNLNSLAPASRIKEESFSSINKVVVTSNDVVLAASGTEIWVGSLNRTFKGILQHGDGKFVMCMAVTADSRWVVSGTIDGTISVWDLESLGEPVDKRRLIRDRSKPKRGGTGVQTITILEDQRTFLVGDILGRIHWFLLKIDATT